MNRFHATFRTGLAALFCIVAGAGGCGNSGSFSPEVNVNNVSLDTEFPNILKGISVAVDPVGNRAFVTGIMTDSVGVIDLDSATLVDAFGTDDEAPTTKKLVYDPGHGKLWMASGKGKRLWIVDPDDRKVLETRDITDDNAPNASSYPVRSIALDPLRERLYIARSDGPLGGRVAIYDSSLNKLGDVLKGRNVHALGWDTERDALLALTAPMGSQGEILTLPAGDESQEIAIPAPYESGWPPSTFAFEPGGSFYVAGKNLWRMAEDGTMEWTTVLPDTPAAIAVSGEEVAVLYQHGLGSEDDIYYSRLETYTADTGSFLVRRRSRFEASRMTVNAATGFFVVGNGGDASVTLFAPGIGEGETLRVGSAAEDILLTPDGERLLVLNRLGGSELIERNLVTGESRVVEAGDWPMRMAMNESTDRLYVLNHFGSRLSILRLSDLAFLGSLSLGLPSCIGDSIAEMAFNEAGTLLACMICEQGKVVIVDTTQETILNTITLADPVTGYGPGRFQGAIDDATGNVFVYIEKEETLYRLDAALNHEVGKSAPVKPGSDAAGGYGLSGLFFSAQLGVLFVNDLLVHPGTLKSLTAVDGICRVVGEETGLIYAQRRDSDNAEYLVKIDVNTLKEISSDHLLDTHQMASYFSLDLQNRKYAVSDPAKAQVTVHDLD